MMQNSRNRTTALILSGGGWPGAYDIVRTLGMAGIGSIVASSHSDDIAFYSRYISEKIVLPVFQPDRYLDILKMLVDTGRRTSQKSVIYYVGDSELAFVRQFRRELSPHFRFLLPPENIIDALMNKASFPDLAKLHDLPVPQTRTFANAAEVGQRIETIEFPCIVKPPLNRDWFWNTSEERERIGWYKSALRRFDSERELLKFCESLPNRSTGFIIQSYVEGENDGITCFNGYFDENSNCLGCFVGEELRTNPPHTGESAYCRTVHDADLVNRSIEYLRRLHFQGIVKIDYKWDGKGQEFKILEIEPHYQSWHLLGAYAGVDLVMAAYRHQRHGEMIGVQDYLDNVHLLHLVQDIAGYWYGYRKTREWSVAAMLRSYTRRNHYRILDPKDPVPFIRSTIKFLKLRLKNILIHALRSKQHQIHHARGMRECQVGVK